MSLEASDLNDGSILGATKQVADAKGNVQFRITLPSGRELVSEFFNPEKIRPARMAWLDEVKAQAAADVQAMQREKREQAREQARQMQNVAQAFDSVKPITNAVVQMNAVAEPIEFVRSQMLSAQEEVETLTKQLGNLRVALDNATLRLQQWTTTHKALTGQEIEQCQTQPKA